MVDYGWNAHVDKTGTPCVYCGEPSTVTLVIEGDQYRNHELVRRGKRVGVCAAHDRKMDPDAPPHCLVPAAQGQGRRAAVYGRRRRPTHRCPQRDPRRRGGVR